MLKRNASMKFPSLLIMLFGLSVLIAACGDSGRGAGLLPATYSISGKVSGDIRQSVNIAVSGAVSANVPTDANGNYSVSGLPNGSYTVTPSKSGYAFTQASRSVAINGDDSSGNDFTTAAVLYTVTGTVSGAVTAGVTITVTGTTEGGSPFTTSITTIGGSYSVPNVPNGDYTVIPAIQGHSFAPVSIAVTISAGNAAIAAFTSTVDNSVKFNLTGTVSGDMRAGVTINVTGPVNGSASTVAGGTYTVPSLPNGTYTVSASKPGYTFGAGISATINDADSSGNNFTAAAVLYSISGTISGDVTTGGTITVAGTTEGGVAFGPVETTTSGNGSYSVPGVPNGVYTVAAAKLGYLFNPASLTVTINAGNSSNRDFTASTNPVLSFRADGGTGTNGTGGNGGQFYADTYGSIKVLKSGTVDASFTVPTITPFFGANPFTVSTDTTVPNTDDTIGALCQVYGGDGSLFIGDGTDGCGSIGDTQVTGLTVAAGATLVLVDVGSGYGTLRLTEDLVINGTLTSDLSSGWGGLDIEAKLIDVESTGKITASATAPDNSGGEIYLGNGQDLTWTIINKGTIETKGDGSGSGGYIYFEPNDLVVNYGTIDVSGGSAGGSGGEFDAYVDYGDFYSSGTIRMNGGNGDTGGETEYNNGNWNEVSCWIETVYRDNTKGRNGDIIISGAWEAKGGDGASGNGGSGGYMYFQTDGIGTITVNASMSVKGGNGTGAGSWGGYAGEINFVSSFDPNGNSGYNDPTPGKISIAGRYDLRGGDGDQDGGSGGYLQVLSQGANSSGVGADMEFVAFPVTVMNGGEGGTNGGSASGNAFRLYTYSYLGSSPAKSITNEADVQAKGGNATLEGATGGMGGYVYIQTGNPGDAATVLSNSGNIDVSGGGGTAGGSAYAIYLQAQHVDNSGNLTANGGTGTTAAGGNGGNITLTSEDAATPTNNTGTLSVVGGAGTPDGADGTTTY